MAERVCLWSSRFGFRLQVRSTESCGISSFFDGIVLRTSQMLPEENNAAAIHATVIMLHPSAVFVPNLLYSEDIARGAEDMEFNSWAGLIEHIVTYGSLPATWPSGTARR